MRALVINLDRSADRLRATAANLDAHGVTWRRLPAIEPASDYRASEPLYDSRRTRYLFGRDLTRGEVGCFLSHLEAIRQLGSDGHSSALVLEDDAEFHAHSLSALENTRDWLNLRYPSWACVNCVQPLREFRRTVGVVSGRTLHRAYQFPLVTAALLWRTEAAAEFRAWCLEVGIHAPVDNQLRDWMSRGHSGFSFDQPPVGLRLEESTVRPPVGDVGKAPLRRSRNKFSRTELRQKVPLYLRCGWRYLVGN
jgi:glycosyl transferase, family 25